MGSGSAEEIAAAQAAIDSAEMILDAANDVVSQAVSDASKVTQEVAEKASPR